MSVENLPSEIDTTTPSVARMYDLYLGGVENYDVDRQACAELDRIAPDCAPLARINRAFLGRVVSTLVEEYGVTQIIDHGSGLPTQNNVHEIAQRINPDVRVVYVDNDPMVLAHGRTCLDENDNTAVLSMDMRDTAEIFDFAERKRLFRPGERTACLFISVLHCLKDFPDERGPAAVVRKVVQRLQPGDFLAISHLASGDPEFRQRVTDLMHKLTQGSWGRVRSRAEIEAYFTGLDVLPPGIVDVRGWRPDPDQAGQDQQRLAWEEWGGVAQVPEA
ncbi:SAM-dependent methyltransferase [Streptomyces sp. B15]|uniref:SAM-dependent methyltransferase n=1 Tax=Streptomyces sp. B15 TaxID=1537797 RepID=UPI001B3761E0|nr:SAM-dependent methyltransferase [Streptomyces sp. B15]MBQ1121914.1 SAM-dependent methyltransferase [Streptomyces sp. B15]